MFFNINFLAEIIDLILDSIGWFNDIIYIFFYGIKFGVCY